MSIIIPHTNTNSEITRYFRLSPATNVAFTRVSLITALGSPIEAWNKKHDRRAALILLEMLQEKEWVLHFSMTGVDADDVHVAQASSMLIDSMMMP